MLPSLTDFDLSALTPESRRALEWVQRLEDETPEEIAADEGITVEEFHLAHDRLAAEVRQLTGLFEIPLLTKEEYEGLRDSIEAHGQIFPVLTSSDGQTIVDGRHRLRACRELRITPNIKKLPDGLDADQLRALALAVNLARRHVTAGARRGIIRAVLLRDPARSDRSIAVEVGVSHTTVADVRRELERAGELANLSSRRGRDGKERPAHPAKPPKPPKEPDPTEVLQVVAVITTVEIPGALLPAGEWVACTAVRLVPRRPGFVLELR